MRVATALSPPPLPVFFAWSQEQLYLLDHMMQTLYTNVMQSFVYISNPSPASPCEANLGESISSRVISVQRYLYR